MPQQCPGQILGLRLLTNVGTDTLENADYCESPLHLQLSEATEIIPNLIHFNEDDCDNYGMAIPLITSRGTPNVAGFARSGLGC